jgi:hypothetical protein
MLVASEAASTEQGALDLRQRRQHRVAFERLRERRDARVADPIERQAARGGSGMLVSTQGRRHRSVRTTYSSDVSVALLLSALESAVALSSPI